MVRNLVFENDEALLKPLNVNPLLVSDLLLLDQLLFKPHLLVDHLLLDGGLDAFESHVVADPLLMLLVDDLRLKIRDFQLERDVFVLDQI